MFLKKSRYIFLILLTLISINIYPCNNVVNANPEVIGKEKAGKENFKKEELYKKIVKVNIRNEEVATHSATEGIIKNLPSSILDMYKEIGGKIEIISDKIIDHPFLNRDINQQHKDIEGRTVSLDDYYVYATDDRENPMILIQASHAFGENYVYDRNVYYEIGKAIARDVFKKIPKWIEDLVPVINQIKGDEDGENLLFTDVLKSYKNQFDNNFSEQHIDDVQEVFARAFGYYFEPHSRNTLEVYAQDMFNYMKEMDEEGFENYNQLLKNIMLTNNDIIDFEMDETQADDWGKKNFKEWEDLLKPSEKHALFNYTTGNGMDLSSMINDYLEEKYSPSSKDLKVIKNHISEMDKGLDKAALPQKMIVYRRVYVEEINKTGKEYTDNDLRKGNTIDKDVVKDLAEKLHNGYINYKRYISTSASKDPSNATFSERPVLLRMELPEGTHAGYIGNISGFPGELEVLIKRGYTFKVTGVSIISTKGKETLQINMKLIK
ncbi:ADP-ribosyltransferase [Bacillus cereus]|uniref:ADP-ribosyltransferase n=1 Tax=Bacillus cereus TaxID=1396 RepID=UPI000C293BC2|nr:ADP-ribosyltransferase [Bacillus cereus]